MIKYLKTKVVPLDQLTPFPGNARRGRVDVIKESLERNGQYRSLVVRQIEHGPLIILAGNHTSMALLEAGAKGARCEIIECDDATARRINLVDNKANDLATDDHDALVELLEALGEDAAGSGFTDKEIAQMLEPSAVPQAPTAPEEFTEYDEGIKTTHRCPKCDYAWSGSSS
jgi:ParB-like chromosome segregation protein Spo0J